MGDDGAITIDIPSPAAVEIFFGYMLLYYDYEINGKDIDWKNIDGRDIINKFLIERTKNSQENTDYGIACSGAITGERAIEHRMEFVKKFFNEYVISKYKINKKDKVLA
jgi:hypothetical protein